MDALADIYSDGFSHTGRPGKDPRLVIGAMIIKHKLCLSDEETVEQIQENPYLQYFVGFPAYTTKIPFVPSLFVDIRKRMDKTVFTGFEQAIIDVVDEKKAIVKRAKRDDEPPTSPPDQLTPEKEVENPEQTSPEHQGKLILDATVAPQKIRFPTDISLLNEAREISEQIIDTLYTHSKLNKKPRTYRQCARKNFLALVKQRRPRVKVRRKAIRKQLNYLKRNLKHIDALWEEVYVPALPCSLVAHQTPKRLPTRLLNKLWVIQILYQQQRAMYESKIQRCDDRIISIHQPHVRPILRGKPNRSAEFGAKLNASLNGDGIACLDEIRWDAFNEGQDLITQVERYKNRHGHYPEVVLADPIYGTRANRKYLKEKSIRYGGKPLGRPKKVTEANKAQLQREKRQRREDYRQRIPIEGKFGQGKNGYDLNLIKAKTRQTSEAWIAAIFFVMNLLVLSKQWDIFAKKWRTIDYLLCVIGLLHPTRHRMTYSGFGLSFLWKL